MYLSERLHFHPLSKLKPLKVDDVGKVRYLTVDEEDALRKALDKRELIAKSKRTKGNIWREERKYEKLPDLFNVEFVDYLKPMVLLSINTGLRQGEIFSITWSNIDLERSILTLSGASTKNRKTRYIPLKSEALDVLLKWQSHYPKSNLVFPNINGERFNNIRKSWSSVLSSANISNFRWHDLRHHFASKLAMAGVDLNTIRELLGHADLKMTLRYAHLAPEHKASAVAKLITT